MGMSRRLSKVETVNLCLGGLANLGVVASFVFTLWTYRQAQNSALAVSCQPAMGEPAEISRFMDLGYVIRYYTWCTVTNTGEKPAYLSRVDINGSGAIGAWAGAWGGTRGDKLTDMVDGLLVLDASGRLRSLLLPTRIEPGQSLNFAATGALPIGNDVLTQLSEPCRGQLPGRVAPRDFIVNCLNRDVVEIPVNSSSEAQAITGAIDVLTTTGEQYHGHWTFHVSERNALSR
jgi:hypothetical protein